MAKSISFRVISPFSTTQRHGDVFGQGGMWYEGRRVLIEQNDYQLNINNGDVGVCRWLHQH